MGRGRYSNPHEEKMRRSLWDFILWRGGYYDDPAEPPVVPEGFTYPVARSALDASGPRARWLNHSSFLLHVAGLNILTDPIWSERCSPLTFLGPKRRHPPPLAIDALPKIDYVLISHNHYDHLDHKSVLALFARFPTITWLVPTGVARWFHKRGIERVIERGWWEEAQLEEGVIATAVPAQHFSGRHARDLNRTLWTGWVLEHKIADKCLYFVGDTGYNPLDFKRIGERWKSIDLSLIPIGSYVPRKFMSPVHIEPRDAVKIHCDVGSRLSLAMHWKTFRLSDEPMEQPPYDLYCALQEQGIDPIHFLAMEPGDELNW